MRNIMLIVFWDENDNHVSNLGRWHYDSDKMRVGDDVKRNAFAELQFSYDTHFWSYEGDGWIVGDAKDTSAPGPLGRQIRAFLSVGLEDIVL